MSKKKGMPDAHATHPNVTPLIDIVMCLIVFFMLVAHIGVNSGADAKISLPTSILGKSLKDIGTNTITLNVRELRDEPFITAMVDTAQPQELKILDPVTKQEQLMIVLRNLRFGKDGKQGGTGVNADNEGLGVVIRGDADVGYRSIAPILAACATAGITNVNFQAAKPKG